MTDITQADIAHVERELRKQQERVEHECLFRLLSRCPGEDEERYLGDTTHRAAADFRSSYMHVWSAHIPITLSHAYVMASPRWPTFVHLPVY